VYISSICLKSYSAFRDSGTAYLKPGINIITGQNSVGKTALLKALDLHSKPTKPHRSTETIKTRGIEHLENSLIEVGFSLTPQDFIEVFRGKKFFFAIPSGIDVNKVVIDISAWLKSDIAQEFACDIQYLDDAGSNTVKATKGYSLWLYETYSNLIAGQLSLSDDGTVNYLGNHSSDYLTYTFLL
jgi:predicted ATPase